MHAVIRHRQHEVWRGVWQRIATKEGVDERCAAFRIMSVDAGSAGAVREEK